MLARRYDLDPKAIAAGGYGTVFKATDKHCEGRVVAVKKCVCVDEAAVQQIRNEATIMQQMDHPSICRIFEVYQEGTTLWLVMEYCEGGEVFARIVDSEEGKLTERTTADIIKQIACALKYSHGLGIAHRDLKPENVCFVGADEADTAVKVIDWGLSSQFLIKKMKSTVGSATYSAPEVLEAKGTHSYSSACDLWSLGVTAYVSLVGKPPFWGGNAQRLKMMYNERYPMEGPEWRSISADAKDFIRGLLKATPLMRTPIDDVLRHPFLQSKRAWDLEPSQVRKVLDNMLLAGSASRFFGICMASAARQLDNRSLEGIHKVFAEFDTKCDGEIDLAELQEAFKQSYGADSEVLAQVEHVFAKLDLDGSQSISYTEFCAAGMGEELCMQEEVLWSAFKAFDVCDNDGIISAGEIQHVLSTGDSNASLPKGLCEKVAREVVETYDVDHNGGIDFSEFKRMMRSCTEGARQTYELLVHADSLANVDTSSSEESSGSDAESSEVPAQIRRMTSADMVKNIHGKKKGRSWARRFLNMMAHATRRSSRHGGEVMAL